MKEFHGGTLERASGVKEGQEKEVDNAMTPVITHWAMRLTYDQILQSHIDKSSIAFVVITGDCDINTAMSATLAERIRVELWSWKDSIATVYRQQANTTQLLTLHEFDSFSDSFTYTSVRSTCVGEITPMKVIVFLGLSEYWNLSLSKVSHGVIVPRDTLLQSNLSPRHFTPE